MWTFGFSNWLSPFVSNNLNQNVLYSCRSDLHNGEEEFPLHKTVSAQQYLWDVWCSSLLWTHATAPQPGWCQGWLGHSKRCILLYWSHSVVDLFLCFESLSHCITHPQLYPVKYPLNLGNHPFIPIDNSNPCLHHKLKCGFICPLHILPAVLWNIQVSFCKVSHV